MTFPHRGRVESVGSGDIFSPWQCPPDANLSREKPTSSLILYALPVAKEVLHVSLVSLPSHCRSLLFFLTVIPSHLQVRSFSFTDPGFCNSNTLPLPRTSLSSFAHPFFLEMVPELLPSWWVLLLCSSSVFSMFLDFLLIDFCSFFFFF